MLDAAARLGRSSNISQPNMLWDARMGKAPHIQTFFKESSSEVHTHTLSVDKWRLASFYHMSCIYGKQEPGLSIAGLENTKRVLGVHNICQIFLAVRGLHNPATTA